MRTNDRLMLIMQVRCSSVPVDTKDVLFLVLRRADGYHANKGPPGRREPLLQS